MKMSIFKAALSVLLIIIIIVTAAWLPKAIFGTSLPVTADPQAADSHSPVGILRSEYLFRALSSSEKFLYEDTKTADALTRASALETLSDFFSKTVAPAFLLSEMKLISDSAVVETLSINTEKGASLPVIHIYLEWKQAWSNWLEAYLDADTGKILYLYISGSKITENTPTDSADLQMPKLETIASVFGEYSGYSLISTEYTDNPNENALTAVYSDDSAQASYKINCIYYAGTMYDIKIEPLP